MKITRRQLRKIIKETMDPMDPNTPDIIYLSEDDGMYSYMQDRAYSAYRRGVRRFGDFGMRIGKNRLKQIQTSNPILFSMKRTPKEP